MQYVILEDVTTKNQINQKTIKMTQEKEDLISAKRYTGVITIPDNLLRYRVSGKGKIPFTVIISFKPSKLNEKIAEWQEKGWSFIKLPQA